jgi:hypothetical protein
LNDGEGNRIAEQAGQARLPVALLFHAASLSRFRNSENVEMSIDYPTAHPAQGLANSTPRRAVMASGRQTFSPREL